MPYSRMEPQGYGRHRWVKPRGRNKRERVSQSFRSSDATPIARRQFPRLRLTVCYCLGSVFLVQAHETGGGGEADSETEDHRRAGPFFLSGQHESGRSTRKVP